MDNIANVLQAKCISNWRLELSFVGTSILYSYNMAVSCMRLSVLYVMTLFCSSFLLVRFDVPVIVLLLLASGVSTVHPGPFLSFYSWSAGYASLSVL